MLPAGDAKATTAWYVRAFLVSVALLPDLRNRM